MLIKKFATHLSTVEEHFHELSKIRKIEIFIELSDESRKHETSLSIWFETVSEKLKLIVTFKNIHMLSLRDLSSTDSFIIIDGFDIIDHKDSQMEDISFEVIDYENDFLHFFCKSIVVKECHS